MKIHRRLGILIALAGAGCDGESGAQGETGPVGPVGAPGEQGPRGPLGIKGTASNVETTGLESGTCPTQYSAFQCTVTCAGVGAIAMARGEVTITQPSYGTVSLTDAYPDPSDPKTYRFAFDAVSIEGIGEVQMNVVCFTPPE